MRDPQSAVNHLLDWAREELAAQRRVLGILELQEAAVHAQDAAATAQSTAELELALEAAPRRSARRARLFHALAERWGVAFQVLSLTSIAERHGPGAEPLLELRDQLEAVATEVAQRNRRVGALIGVHRRVTRDVIRIVLGDEHGDPLGTEGTLVDAQA